MVETALLIDEVTGAEGKDAILRSHNGQRKNYSQAEIDLLDAAAYGIGTLERDDGALFFCDGLTFKIISELQSKTGWINLHPSDYQADRQYLATNGWTRVDDDGLGVASNDSFLPDGVSKIFNTTTGQLDFSQLAIGDTFEVRLDFDVTTSVNNQEIQTRAEFAIGSGQSYTVALHSAARKSIGTYQLSAYSGGPIASEGTRVNPAEIQLFSDENFTYQLKMIYIHIIRR